MLAKEIRHPAVQGTSLHNQAGCKKIKKKKSGWDLHSWEGVVKEERFLHYILESPFISGEISQDKKGASELRGECSS